MATTNSATQGVAFNHMCPLCNNELRRTWRRPVDRFASIFLPLHRYRCGNFSCQWEGNFRVHSQGAKGTDMPATVHFGSKPVSHTLPALIASGTALATVLVVILIGSIQQPREARADSTATGQDRVASTSLVPTVHGQEIPVGPRRSPGTKLP